MAYAAKCPREKILYPLINVTVTKSSQIQSQLHSISVTLRPGYSKQILPEIRLSDESFKPNADRGSGLPSTHGQWRQRVGL